jgi:hypothetical protein
MYIYLQDIASNNTLEHMYPRQVEMCIHETLFWAPRKKRTLKNLYNLSLIFVDKWMTPNRELGRFCYRMIRQCSFCFIKKGLWSSSAFVRWIERDSSMKRGFITISGSIYFRNM